MEKIGSIKCTGKDEVERTFAVWEDFLGLFSDPEDRWHFYIYQGSRPAGEPFEVSLQPLQRVRNSAFTADIQGGDLRGMGIPEELILFIANFTGKNIFSSTSNLQSDGAKRMWARLKEKKIADHQEDIYLVRPTPKG